MKDKAATLLAMAESLVAVAKIQVLMEHDKPALEEALKVVPPMWPMADITWAPSTSIDSNIRRAHRLLDETLEEL